MLTAALAYMLFSVSIEHHHQNAISHSVPTFNTDFPFPWVFCFVCLLFTSWGLHGNRKSRLNGKITMGGILMRTFSCRHSKTPIYEQQEILNKLWCGSFHSCSGRSTEFDWLVCLHHAGLPTTLHHPSSLVRHRDTPLVNEPCGSSTRNEAPLLCSDFS